MGQLTKVAHDGKADTTKTSKFSNPHDDPDSTHGDGMALLLLRGAAGEVQKTGARVCAMLQAVQRQEVALMKIRETLRVTDDARRCIAANMKKENLPYLATQDGLATRATVVAWLQAALDKATALGSPEFKLDPLERDETRLAVEQLRAAGWPDSRIRAWLLKQAALMEGVKLELWPAPILDTQPAEFTAPTAHV